MYQMVGPTKINVKYSPRAEFYSMCEHFVISWIKGLTAAADEISLKLEN